jgi:hypothetical protein
MQFISPRHLRIAAFLLMLMTMRYAGATPPPESNGTIAVLVTWDDVNNTPANDAYIEAHGYMVKDKAEQSFPSR